MAGKINHPSEDVVQAQQNKDNNRHTKEGPRKDSKLSVSEAALTHNG